MYKTILSFLILTGFASCKPATKPEAKVLLVRDGVPIAHTDSGKGDTTLLFIHGWCINKEYWQPQVDHFSSQYRVVTVDLPGFGASGKNRTQWTFDDYTEDIRFVIEALKLKNVVLIGHSMSGDIVLNAGNKYPELLAGIVGIDNLHEPTGPYPDSVKAQMDGFFSMMKISFDSTVNAVMRGGLFQPSTDTAIVRRVLNDISSTDSLRAVAVLQALSDFSQKEKQLMLGLQHKLLLVNSDVFKVNADSLKKYCAKGFGVELVPSTGHYPMIEKPDQFNAALQRALLAMRNHP